MSDFLRPHGLQHVRPPFPSPTPGVYSNMCHESVMPSNHLILCNPFLLPSSIFPSIRVFSNESVLCIRRPKYWSCSFSIIPSKEIPGLILLQNGLVGSPCSPRASQESSPIPQFYLTQLETKGCPLWVRALLKVINDLKVVNDAGRFRVTPVRWDFGGGFLSHRALHRSVQWSVDINTASPGLHFAQILSEGCIWRVRR